MKRTPLTRRSPLRPGKPLVRKRIVGRKVIRRAQPERPLAVWCEARLPVCTGRAEHRHHKLRRSQGGTDELSNLIDLCGRCHEYAHSHPSQAYALGLLTRRESA